MDLSRRWARLVLFGAVLFLATSAVLSGCGSDPEGSAGSEALDAAGTSDAVASLDEGTVADATGTEDATLPDAGTSSDLGVPDAATVCGPATGERPARRSEQAGAWDPKGKRLVMFGGSFAVPQNCSFVAATSETETWVYDSACDAWRQSLASGPAGRARANGVWKEGLGLVVFGGRSRVGTSGPYTLYNDTWAYDPDQDAWTEIAAAGVIPKRFNATAALRDDTGELLVFGGNTSGSALQYVPNNDVWTFSFDEDNAFDKAKWTKVATDGKKPPARFFAAGSWDSTRKRLVVYGGADASLFSASAKFKADLWALDFNQVPAQWAQIDLDSSKRPDGRYWSSMVYDGANDRYLIFGGHDDKSQGNRNDLWAFDPASGQWSNLVEGDLFNKPANGFCSFPPDFTTVVEDLPERRNGGLVVGAKEGIWIAGGKTDCGVIDDLFFFDYPTSAWTEMTTATVGESCLRKGGVGCNDYCQ